MMNILQFQDIQVDYSLDSHVKDYDEYVNIARYVPRYTYLMLSMFM